MNLKDKLEKRLAGGKFRFINEKLYNNSRTKLDEPLLPVYHDGFRTQTKKWKEQPLNLIKAKLHNSEIIVDMGCGEAELSKHFQAVISFDLYPVNNRAIRCDMRHVPLQDQSVDVVVFCLSLMAKDVCKSIKEANRILRDGGRLIIAEVASRITRFGVFLSNIELLGFKSDDRYTNGYLILAEFSKTKVADSDHKVSLKSCTYKKR